MDQALRNFEHELRRSPGDLQLARRYRAALRRHAAREAEEAASRLDRLQGVLVFPRSGESGPAGEPASNHWRRVATGRPHLLEPEPPAHDALRRSWETEGELRYLSAGVALVETRDEGLEARRPEDGTLLWRVEPELGPGLGAPDVSDWELERREVVGWAVTSWGAARLAARFEREPERRRVGRHSARGRWTESEVVGHGAERADVSLQLVLPDPTWTAGPPETLVYPAALGESLADSALELSSFHDELLAISLDTESRQLAIRWRDADQEWEVLLVTGDVDLSSSVGPSGWSAPPPNDPFAVVPRTRTPHPPLRHANGAPVELPPLDERQTLQLDQGVLVIGQGERGLELHQVDVVKGEQRRRFVDWNLEALLDGRRLRARGPGHAAKDATLLVADRRLVLQAGETLSVWEDA